MKFKCSPEFFLPWSKCSCSAAWNGHLTNGLFVLFLLFSGDSSCQSESIRGKWRWTTALWSLISHFPLGNNWYQGSIICHVQPLRSDVRGSEPLWLFALEISQALIWENNSDVLISLFFAAPLFLNSVIGPAQKCNILASASRCRNRKTFSFWKSGRRTRVSTVHHRRHAESLSEWIPQVRLRLRLFFVLFFCLFFFLLHLLPPLLF